MKIITLNKINFEFCKLINRNFNKFLKLIYHTINKSNNIYFSKNIYSI